MSCSKYVFSHVPQLKFLSLALSLQATRPGMEASQQGTSYAGGRAQIFCAEQV